MVLSTGSYASLYNYGTIVFDHPTREGERLWVGGEAVVRGAGEERDGCWITGGGEIDGRGWKFVKLANGPSEERDCGLEQEGKVSLGRVSA